MRLLLDSHALLWALGEPDRLSASARVAIADGNNVVFVSAASMWEIAIKQAAGKVRVPSDLAATIDESGLGRLSISFEHALAAGVLPLHHRDPFDRMLVAQAGIEGLTIVTRDSRFERYGVPLLEA